MKWEVFLLLLFETHVSSSTLTETLRLHQEGIKVLQRSKSLVAKYGGVVDSHATSNPAISDEEREKNGLKLRVSLSL